MPSLTLSPSHNAHSVSPTAQVKVLGAVPGETFDYSTLILTIDGAVAVNNEGVQRPAFKAVLVKTASSFVLTVTPRRPFLYRVKVTVAVTIRSDVREYTAASTFEVRDRSTALPLSSLRRTFGVNFRLPEAVALHAVNQQLAALLGGDAGVFAVRLIRRVFTSQLWPAMKRLVPESSTDQFLAAMASMEPADVSLRTNAHAVLSMIEIFWEPALQQVVELGVTVPFAELLNRAFRSENDLERLAAACSLILLGSAFETAPAATRELFVNNAI